MASHSFTEQCRNPHCNGTMDCCEDSRDGRSEYCAHCGHSGYMKYKQCPLDELNERRENNNEAQELKEGDEDFLAPLTELPPYEES